MKITIFIKSMINSRGTERVVANLSSMFSERGHDVEILLLGSSKESFYKLNDNVQVASLGIDKRNVNENKLQYLFRIISSIRRYIKEEQPDAMLAIWTDISIFSILASVGLKTKIIACEHISSDRKLATHEKIRRFVYPLADAIAALTEHDKNVYSKMNKMSFNIPNALRQFEDTQEVKQENIVLAVGTIEHRKGFDLLIDAWKTAGQSMDGWKLKIIGDAADSKYKQLLIDKINNDNLQTSISVEPAVNNIALEYRKATIFVLPSRMEGLPMVLIEAMSNGLAPISFDCPTGPRTLINNDETGILVENGNVFALAQAMIKLTNDHKTRSRYAVNAKRDIETRFSEDAVYKQWTDVFKMLQL